MDRTDTAQVLYMKVLAIGFKELGFYPNPILGDSGIPKIPTTSTTLRISGTLMCDMNSIHDHPSTSYTVGEVMIESCGETVV